MNTYLNITGILPLIGAWVLSHGISIAIIIAVTAAVLFFERSFT